MSGADVNLSKQIFLWRPSRNLKILKNIQTVNPISRLRTLSVLGSEEEETDTTQCI